MERATPSFTPTTTDRRVGGGGGPGGAPPPPTPPTAEGAKLPPRGPPPPPLAVRPSADTRPRAAKNLPARHHAATRARRTTAYTLMPPTPAVANAGTWTPMLSPPLAKVTAATSGGEGPPCLASSASSPSVSWCFQARQAVLRPAGCPMMPAFTGPFLSGMSRGATGRPGAAARRGDPDAWSAVDGFCDLRTGQVGEDLARILGTERSPSPKRYAVTLSVVGLRARARNRLRSS
ncbi:hypothetical protein KNE206_73850 [Kitasatospora sp. NE20-6]